MVTQTTSRPDIRTSSRTASISRWVQLISLAAGCYNVGIILMTQLGYRLWARVGRAEFEDYHRAWWYGWGGIQPLSFPSGIVATLGALAQLRWRSPHIPSWLVWLNINVWIQAWVMTAVWWGQRYHAAVGGSMVTQQQLCWQECCVCCRASTPCSTAMLRSSAPSSTPKCWTARIRCRWAQHCCTPDRRWGKNTLTTHWCGP